MFFFEWSRFPLRVMATLDTGVLLDTKASAIRAFQWAWSTDGEGSVSAGPSGEVGGVQDMAEDEGIAKVSRRPV